jgi:membrane protein YdbS with pleckstrin-like domain
MTDSWFSLFWLACGGFVMTFLSATALSDRPREWWRVAWGVAAASALIIAALVALLTDTRENNTLARDVAAAFTIVILCPISVGAVVQVRRIREGRWWVRVAVSVERHLVRHT